MAKQSEIEKIKCPACGELTSPEGEKCSVCSTDFPWMSHIWQRETAIMRALYSVSTDVYESVAQGKKVNKSKLMGLINAILVRRTVFVLGSVFGGLFLILEIFFLIQQNDLIENQNKMIQDQTSFTRFEQLKTLNQLFEQDTTRNLLDQNMGLRPGPSGSNISLVTNLVRSDSALVRSFFPTLLAEGHVNTKIGALKVLNNLRMLSPSEEVMVILNDVRLENLDFSGLPISQFSCTNCYIHNVKIESTCNLLLSINSSVVANVSVMKNSSDTLTVTSSNSILWEFNAKGDHEDKFYFKGTFLLESKIETVGMPKEFYLMNTTDGIVWIWSKPGNADNGETILYSDMPAAFIRTNQLSKPEMKEYLRKQAPRLETIVKWCTVASDLSQKL